MNRTQLVKHLADCATRPLTPTEDALHQIEAARQIDATTADSLTAIANRELFIWFEDTSARPVDGRRGVAGLPESLLPYSQDVRVIERRFAAGHVHLLAAARIECNGDRSETIAALYTAALSVGTIAWVGTGAQYARVWNELYTLGVEPRLTSPQ
jgi:hypothetical protein